MGGEKLSWSEDNIMDVTCERNEEGEGKVDHDYYLGDWTGAMRRRDK